MQYLAGGVILHAIIRSSLLPYFLLLCSRYLRFFTVGYTLDPTTGYLHNPETGYYYDERTQKYIYIDETTKQFMYYDRLVNKYLPYNPPKSVASPADPTAENTTVSATIAAKPVTISAAPQPLAPYVIVVVLYPH